MANKELKSLNFGSGDIYYPLPIVSAEDNDKVLMVVDGEWVPSAAELSGAYLWSKQGMGETVTSVTGTSYTLTTANTTRPSSKIEYSTSAPIYEDGTWKMPNSTIETIVNTDTYVPSATNVYVRLTSEPNVWYYVSKFTAGSLNTSGTCTKSMAYSTKYTAEAGSDIVGYVAGNDSNKYPDGGWHTDGYYYEKITNAEEASF